MIKLKQSVHEPHDSDNMGVLAIFYKFIDLAFILNIDLLFHLNKFNNGCQ